MLFRQARKQLGWEPKVDFRGLVEMMVDADMARLSGGTPQTAAELFDRAAQHGFVAGIGYAVLLGAMTLVRFFGGNLADKFGITVPSDRAILDSVPQYRTELVDTAF